MRLPPRGRIVFYIVAAVLAATIAFAPTPYSLILPGSAIDLRSVVSVAGHPPPRQQFFMTDVTLQERVSPLLLLEGLLPGTRIVHTDEVVPHGVSIPEFDDIMKRAMDESHVTAAVVAERAARLAVGIPNSRVSVDRLDDAAPAKSSLLSGDVIETVNGKAVHSTVNVQDALFHLHPGDRVTLGIVRRGSHLSQRVRTMSLKGHTRIGVYLIAQIDAPRLPVIVKFNSINVSGSSGGLMFALDIYRTLRPAPTQLQKIAGTGTISYDGTVGPIEGAAQKVIAAKHAGAQLFLVPIENYKEIEKTPGIRIIPVHTFNEAVKALSRTNASHPSTGWRVTLPV